MQTTCEAVVTNRSFSLVPRLWLSRSDSVKRWLEITIVTNIYIYGQAKYRKRNDIMNNFWAFSVKRFSDQPKGWMWVLSNNPFPSPQIHPIPRPLPVCWLRRWTELRYSADVRCFSGCSGWHYIGGASDSRQSFVANKTTGQRARANNIVKSTVHSWQTSRSSNTFRLSKNVPTHRLCFGFLNEIPK